jgi:hypothetical protein
LEIAMRKKSRGNMGRILEELEKVAVLTGDTAGASGCRVRINAITEGLEVLYGQVTRDGDSIFSPYVTFFDR